MGALDFIIKRLDTLRKQHRNSVEGACWISLWLVVSPGVINGIRTLTANQNLNFGYPWMLIGFTNGGVWVLLTALQYVPGPLRHRDSEVVVPHWQACTLGVLQGFEVGIGADILKMVSITLRTEINMLCPALMFGVGIIAGLETLEPRLAGSIVAVTCGGLLASYGTMTWQGLDLVPLALLAALLSTWRWVLTQKWLSPHDARRKPSSLSLAQRMSPATSAVGFAVAAVRERAGYQGLSHLPYPGEVAALLCAISVGVCLLVAAEMRAVQLLSALLFSFIVPFHNVTVILLDARLKGTHISGLNWVGILVCAVATGLYSVARAEEKSSAHVRPKHPLYQSAGTPPESVTA